MALQGSPGRGMERSTSKGVGRFFVYPGAVDESKTGFIHYSAWTVGICPPATTAAARWFGRKQDGQKRVTLCHPFNPRLRPNQPRGWKPGFQATASQRIGWNQVPPYRPPLPLPTPPQPPSDLRRLADNPDLDCPLEVIPLFLGGISPNLGRLGPVQIWIGRWRFPPEISAVLRRSHFQKRSLRT